MTVIKNEKSNTWEVRTYFKNLQGDRKQKTKRGFKTRREAVAWEAAFKTEEHCDLNMTFESYYRIYERDIKPTLKLNTWKTKQAIVEKKILPFIGNRKIDSLTPADIRAWQVEVMNLTKKNGEPLSQDYLRTIHCQLSAMLNHAVRFYGLKRNVANVAGSMGGESYDEIKFWTQTEYEKFAEAVADKPLSYFAFEILYWCGLRLGEMQALTPEDIDFERNTIRINKSYQRINRKDVITPPKTPKSNRTVYMPKSLGLELKCFFETLYGLKATDRIFTVSKSYMHHEMDRGSKAAGLERIKVHGLRHSHVSLLINKGYTALEIGDRVGHEAQEITYRYAHLFPTIQTDMAKTLDDERSGK